MKDCNHKSDFQTVDILRYPNYHQLLMDHQTEAQLRLFYNWVLPENSSFLFFCFSVFQSKKVLENSRSSSLQFFTALRARRLLKTSSRQGQLTFRRICLSFLPLPSHSLRITQTGLDIHSVRTLIYIRVLPFLLINKRHAQSTVDVYLCLSNRQRGEDRLYPHLYLWIHIEISFRGIKKCTKCWSHGTKGFLLHGRKASTAISVNESTDSKICLSSSEILLLSGCG